MPRGGGRLHGSAAKVLCVALSVALAPGCTTTRPVLPRPDGYQETIRPGDQLRVVTRSGPTLELRVTAVTGEAIVGILGSGPSAGAQVVVPFWDVASIQRTELSGGKTAGLVAGIGAAVVTALAVVFFVMVIGFATSWGERVDGPGRASPPPFPP